MNWHDISLAGTPKLLKIAASQSEKIGLRTIAINELTCKVCCIKRLILYNCTECIEEPQAKILLSWCNEEECFVEKSKTKLEET